MDSAVLHAEALRLSPVERALLADALLGSLDEESSREVEVAWGQIADARLADCLREGTETLDGPTLLSELRRRYAP